MGVQRRLPTTDEQRAEALLKAQQKIAISAPADIVLSAQTQARLAAEAPVFLANMAARGQALAQQVTKTPVKDTERKTAAKWISHYIQAHDDAASRQEPGFVHGDRAYFQLADSNSAVPSLDSDGDVVTWGDRIVTGDANRIADGRPVIPFPTIGAVTSRFNTFKTSLGQHNLLKKAYDDAQELIENARPDIDSLIKRMWNEIEAAYSEEAAPSMRRNAREWGVVYIHTGGAPDPADFAIMGTITDSVTGQPVQGVAVVQVNPEVIVLTDADGKFLLPRGNAGTFVLQVHKAGYADQQFNNVVVVDDVITVQNVQLVATQTGTIEGVVTKGGNPVAASISFSTTPVGVNSDPASGLYSKDSVPAGSVTITCTIIATNEQQVTNTSVPANGIININFTFP